MYCDFRHVPLPLSVAGEDILYLLQSGPWASAYSLIRFVLAGQHLLMILVGPLAPSGPIWPNALCGPVAGHWSRDFWVSLSLIVIWMALLIHACSLCALASLRWS